MVVISKKQIKPKETPLILWIINETKKWSGQNLTSRTGSAAHDKATQTRFTVYRQHFSHIPSGWVVIIHYSLAIFFKIISHTLQ